MKKFILMALCIACTTNISAQKDMVVHKKDGTTIRIPMILKPTVSFWGKNVTKDNDYVTVSEISGKKDGHDITVSVPEGSDYILQAFDSCGVVWSSTPGVTIENGVKASLINDGYDRRHYQIAGHSLDYETEYYYRAYVCKYGLTYYSEEKSHIFYQNIRTFIGYTPEWDFEQSAYVYPTDEAFKSGFKGFTGIECSDTSLAVLKEEWKAYLTQDKAKELIAKGGEIKKCHEGDLCYINEISEDFINAMFEEGTSDCTWDINYDTDYNGEALYTRMCTIDTVICDSKWDVEGNIYWKATSTFASAHPCVGINLPNALPGYTYKISITFAPDTEAEADSLALPNKVNLSVIESDENGKMPTTGKTINNPDTGSRDFEPGNTLECSTINVEWNATDFQKRIIQIRSKFKSTERNIYSRTLRIAKVAVELKKKEATK